MVKHIVFFKLEDNSYENKETIRYMILNLKDKISVIKGFEVGINFSQEQRAYDLALVSDFENDDVKDFKNISFDEMLKTDKYEAKKLLGKKRYELFIDNKLNAKDIFDFKNRKFYTIEELKVRIT